MSAGQKERKEAKVRVKGMRVGDVQGWGWGVCRQGQLAMFSEGLLRWYVAALEQNQI